MGISERGKEIKRRRQRRKKLAQYGERFKKARHSERAVIIEKVRRLTPGANAIFANWGVDEQELQK